MTPFRPKELPSWIKGEACPERNLRISADADERLVKQKDKITEKIYTFDKNLKIHEKAITYDQADKILLKARDEAHRFANSYRKQQMSKERK
jgi:hypothetical protein